MKKDEILNLYWFTYLKWWKHEINDTTRPPTEDHFWAWYAKDRVENAGTVNSEYVNP